MRAHILPFGVDVCALVDEHAHDVLVHRNTRIRKGVVVLQPANAYVSRPKHHRAAAIHSRPYTLRPGLLPTHPGQIFPSPSLHCVHVSDLERGFQVYVFVHGVDVCALLDQQPCQARHSLAASNMEGSASLQPAYAVRRLQLSKPQTRSSHRESQQAYSVVCRVDIRTLVDQLACEVLHALENRAVEEMRR